MFKYNKSVLKNEMKKIVMPLTFGAVFIVLSIGFSGCLEGINEDTNDIERFIGTWTLDAADTWYELTYVSEITFSNVNSFTTDAEISGDYMLENEKLILTYDNGQQEISFSYRFSTDYTKLNLIDPNKNAASYTKK